MSILFFVFDILFITLTLIYFIAKRKTIIYKIDKHFHKDKYFYKDMGIFQEYYRKLNTQNFTKIGNFCDIAKIKVGKNTYGTINVNDSTSQNVFLEIGNYCSIGPNVVFLLGSEHDIKNISTYPFKVMKFNDKKEAFSKGSIIVKDDVWIGANVIICSGIEIGQGSVIAAGAVVTKDVEPYSIIGGNPAKLIKYRFDEDIIDKLLSLNVVNVLDNCNQNNIDLYYTHLTETVLDKLIDINSFNE